jgi:hypothetical protein
MPETINQDKSNKSNSKLKKTGKAVIAVGGEISGFTFLKRGISSHVNIGRESKQFVTDTFNETKSQMKVPKVESLNNIPRVQRQIKQANALYSACLSFLSLFVVLIVIINSLFVLKFDFISLFIEDNKFLYLSSLAVGFSAFIFVLFSGLISYKDFIKITRSTTAPYDLSMEYRSSLLSLCSIFVLQNSISTLMQTAPDLSYIKAIAGFFTITLSISLFYSARKTYDPRYLSQSPINLLPLCLTSFFGRNIGRFYTQNMIPKSPIFLLSISFFSLFINILTKDIGAVSIISLFISIIGFGAIIAMTIHGWFLKND